MKTSSIIIKVLWLLLIIMLGTYLKRGLEDPDLWWHTVIGRWILANQSVPRVEIWNAFRLGEPVYAYSWLVELLLAGVESRWGLTGLFTLQSFLGVCLAFIFCWSLTKLSGSYVFGGLLGSVVCAACLSSFALRPQCFSWGILLLIIVVSESIRSSGLSKGRLFGLWLLCLLWANTNITVIMGIAVSIVWVLNLRELFSWKAWKAPLSIALVGFAGSLCTPYFGAEWRLAGELSKHPWLYNNIIEFGPGTIYRTGTVIVLLLLSLACFFIHYQPRKIVPSHILIAGGFLMLSLLVLKFTPHAAISLAAVLAVIWREHRQTPADLGKLGEGISLLEGRIEALGAYPGTMVGVVLLVGILNNIVGLVRMPLFNPIFTAVGALDFVQQNMLPTPLGHTFGDGGYVLYRYADARGVPAFPVAIDGRTQVNDPEVARLYRNALEGAEGWRQFIDKTKPETIVWPNASAFNEILRLSPEWCEVYRDQTKPKKASLMYQSTGYAVFIKAAFFEKNRDRFSSPDCS